MNQLSFHASLLNPTSEVFQITESLKKSIRVKSQLSRSNTIQEPKIKSTCTLPNIVKNSKTPKSVLKVNFFPITANNSDNSPSYLSTSYNKFNFKTPTVEMLKKNEEQLESNQYEKTLETEPSLLMVSNVNYSKSFAPPSKIPNFPISPIRTKSNINKFKFEDPYIYSKIMKYHDFTPFQKLLPTSGESNTGFYPYFTRVSREIKKTESILLPKFVKNPKSYKDCSCPLIYAKSHAREIPHENDLKRMCDEILPYYIKSHECDFNNCYLIINFEGVIGHISENKLKLRRGAMKFISKACKIFKIIILSNSQRILSTIANVMEMKMMKISAIYYFNTFENKEIMHLERIYTDFQIKSPSENVLVLSSLNSEIHKNDPIFPNVQRVNKKLHISMCPVSNGHSPITFLIQHMLINLNAKPLETLWNSFNSKKCKEKFSFQEWLKDFRVKFKIIRSTLPFEIMMEKMPLKKNNKFCKLHNKNVLFCEDIPFNFFVLYLDS